MKSAFVAVVGRPSAGKSTLLNLFCGYKVSIISNIPQTTRNKIRGIVNRDIGQLVFIDTPGYHNSNRKFNLHMKQLVQETLEEVDCVLYVMDTSRPPGDEEREMAAMVSSYAERSVVALNKIDIEPTYRDEMMDLLQQTGLDAPVFPVSAVQGDGTEELLAALFDRAPDGELMYPADLYTDQEPAFRIAEIIREKAVNRVREELPHALYVDVADIETDERQEKLWIRAFLVTERESQKGILVGKKGSMIKAVRTDAQKEIASLFPYRIHLDLRVKVQPNWRKNAGLLDRLIQ